jgi:hypothetical protein
VTKVRNAQSSGAIACLIGDDFDEKSESLQMIDDSSDQDIQIPSFFISQSTFDMIFQYSGVVMKISKTIDK